MKPILSIINESTVLNDADVQSAVIAVQNQVSWDFAALWNQDADLRLIKKRQDAGSSDWQVVILDTPDQANALGYHELTASGNPIGKIFAGADMVANTSWTVTLSHEVLEMLADPWIDSCSQWSGPDGSTQFFALEVCDPCEADNYGYKIRDILVSDFVYPRWFTSIDSLGQYDHKGAITQPFQLLTGGYISIFSNGKWTQITERCNPDCVHSCGPIAARGSRRDRRGLSKTHWRHSMLHASL